MYKVYCDNYLIYDDSLESLKIFDATISLELNNVGSFEFAIYPTHPYFDKLNKMKSMIKVYQDENLIFKGRILSDVNGFYNEKKVTCESDLAFLLDSIQRPYEFQGTPAELFTQLINNHNEQVNANHQFNVGNITVTDPNDYINRSDSTYLNTFDSIKQKLIDGLGGYLNIRYEDNGNYIDYLSDFNTLSNQKIEFGENLLELSRTVDANEIFTVIIPVGAEISEEPTNEEPIEEETETVAEVKKEKLTIKEVNDGLDYLEHAEGIAQYGRIVKMIEWNDVTEPLNLKRKAQEYLNNSVLLLNTIEISAADLSAINKDINSFRLGTKVQVISEPHNIDSIYLVDKLSINILNPADTKLQLGSTFKSMTDIQQNEIKTLVTEVNTKVESVKNDAILETTKQLQSNIESTSSQIISNISEIVYTKDEIPEIIEQHTSEMKQSLGGWEQNWIDFKIEYDEDKALNDEQFRLIEKYIRYIDGKIILGEVGNELELKISNDRLSFVQNNTEVAYFSNNKLFVTDGEYTNSLQLGKFAFLPRTNGNLSFKKVVN